MKPSTSDISKFNASKKQASKYYARESDANGYIDYPGNEHDIWQRLFLRQEEHIGEVACKEYLSGVQRLNLPSRRIPQLYEVNAVLQEITGWQVQEVSALISFDTFFSLLANKKFPVATFIRTEEDLDYLQEPDIFHEIFGHCPLLTNTGFACFTECYGQLALTASKQERVFLARLYWFTVEFGLLYENNDTAKQRDMRIYGGGILSSPGESEYALGSEIVDRRRFNLVDIMRTPYRIDIMQPIYYVLDSFEQLFEITQTDIMAAVRKAMSLGLFSPTFPTQKYSS